MPDLREPRTKEELIRDFRTGEILEAARRVIETLGLPDASMERIAQEAGVAKGTIYLYFRNKEELLMRVVQDAFSHLIASTHAATRDVSGAAAKLTALVRNALAHASQHHEFFRVVGERANVGASASQIDDEFDREVAEYVDLIARVIEEGVASGELRACSTRRAALFITESLRGTIRARLREESPPDVERETETIVDVFLHGIEAKGSA